MTAGTRSRFIAPDPGQRARPPTLSAISVLMAVVSVAIDFTTWIELNIAIVYGLPLVVAAAARNRKLLWVLTIVLLCATFTVYFLQVPRDVFSILEPYFIDRVLAGVSILFAAGLLHALSVATDALDERSRALDRQTRLLEAVNDRLRRQQEEITRRNEELDLQRLEASEASDRKTRLLMSISHDIRTPLTTINVMADLIRKSAASPQLPDRLPELTRTLQASALALTNMVTDVLDISSVDTGRVELRDSEFSLDDLLVEECRALHALALAKGLRLTHEPTQPAIRLRADRIKLARVLRNLVTNAIQFTEHGSVTLRAALTPGGEIEIRVIDTGVGIAAEDMERIFSESTRVRHPQSHEAEGWGLGLPISRRLTRMMGGEVQVESRSGHGSAFIVQLPPSRVLRP
jgi:signal transduction histidine kinase